jgi:thioredoxin 1
MERTWCFVLKRALKMKMIGYLIILGVTLTFISDVKSLATEPNRKAGSDTIEAMYPGLASGPLTYARVSKLPEGVLLKTEGLVIQEKEITAQIAGFPEEVQDQWKKNTFFLLETMAEKKLLPFVARAELKKAGKNITGKNDQELAENYLADITAKIPVTDIEMKQFYRTYQHIFGQSTYEEAKPTIKQFLLKKKQEEIIEQTSTNFGKMIPVEISRSWVQKRYILENDNPIAKARKNQKTTLVVFGGSGCCGSDRMLPIVEALQVKYDQKLNIVHLQVKAEQVLADRYHVKSIPTILFYDINGKEYLRRAGMMSQDEIEKELPTIGVKNK